MSDATTVEAAFRIAVIMIVLLAVMPIFPAIMEVVISRSKTPFRLYSRYIGWWIEWARRHSHE